AGRKVEIATGLGDHAVHDAKELAATADGERLDGREPRLLDEVLELLIVGFRAPVTAIELVHQAELALDQKIDERNLTVIKMREVDAGVEDAAAGMLRMLHGAAAQDADLDCVVE